MPKKQTKTAKSRRKPTSKRAPRKAAAKRRSPRAPVPRDPQVVAALSQARIRKLLRAPTLPPKPPGPPGPPMDPPIQLTALTVDTKNQLVMGAPVTLNLQLFAGNTGGTYVVRVVATLYKGTKHGAVGDISMNDWVETSVFVQMAAGESKSFDVPTSWLWPATTNADRIFDQAPTMFIVSVWSQNGATLLAHGRLLPLILSFASQ